MKLWNLLSFRLFLILLATIAVGTAIFTKVSIDRQTELHLNSAIQSASRVSDVIKRSTEYSMLLNRREDTYHSINTIGSEPGIEAIRIYNKKGEISFSTNNEEVGHSVDMSAEACNVCHSPNKPPHPGNVKLTRIYTSSKGYRVLGMIVPIKNEPKCTNDQCHWHGKNQTVLGVLDVILPLKDIDQQLDELKESQYSSALSMLVLITIATGGFLLIVVNLPVRRLIRGTEEVTKGNLQHRIPVRSTDELGQLATSFNTMTAELQGARDELTQWAQTLEDRVAQKTEELQRAQINMVQMEKMVSLGKLAATVAHELNNPLEGVLTYAKLLKRRMNGLSIEKEMLDEIQSELSIIADETSRCGNIVKNLLLFSRQRVGEFIEEDVRAIIERSLKLIDHHLQIHNIKLITNFGETATKFWCDPQQIEQALLAIELNAIEAMPDGGSLTITIANNIAPEEVGIVIRDTGIGIPEEALPHIFEPFFTTKESGKGTGLGLAVVYGIVERHNGKITVQSKPTSGTVFTMVFPKGSVPPTPES